MIVIFLLYKLDLSPVILHPSLATRGLSSLTNNHLIFLISSTVYKNKGARPLVLSILRSESCPKCINIRLKWYDQSLCT